MRSMRNTRGFWLALITTAGIGWMMQAQAGMAFRELEPKIATDVKNILIKHGMPVKHNRENGWFKIGSGSTEWIGGDPAFTLYFYKAHEIPMAAQVEVIAYCMKLYEETHRQNRIRIQMRTEAFEPTIFKPEPYFELMLKVVKKQ